MKTWSPQDESYLTENIREMSLTALSLKFNRDQRTILTKACRMGLLKPTNHNRWSNTEIAWLKENYKLLTPEQQEKHLRRTWNAIRYKAMQLNLKRYH